MLSFGSLEISLRFGKISILTLITMYTTVSNRVYVPVTSQRKRGRGDEEEGGGEEGWGERGRDVGKRKG